MQYYYLDGLDKKGPYTQDELKGRNLNPETLVFSDSMENWRPIKDLPELNSYLFTTETAIEAAPQESSPDTDQPNAVAAEEKTALNSEQSKIKIPSVVFLFLSFGLCIGLAYLIASSQKQSDLDAINKKVDAIFQGKSAVTDYTFDGSNGQLYDVYLSSFFEGIGNDKNVVRTKKRILAYKPTDGDDEKYAVYNETKRKQWDLFKNLVQYYETTPFSGFDAIRIEKNSSTFSIIKSWSGDMAYKVPESRHVAGYSSEFYTSPGYDIPTYRPTIGKCYEEAAKYLTVEKEDKSYEAGSYNKIYSFPEIESKFFEIVQRYPKYTRLLDKIHVDMGNKSEGDVIDNAKITDATSATDAHVFTNQWIVWYKSLTNTYAIEEKKGVFSKQWLIYSAIGMAIASLVFFILKYRKRIAIK